MESITTVTKFALPYIVLFTYAIERFLLSPFALHKTQQWRIVWPISRHKNGKMQIPTSKQWKLPSTILLKPSALLNDKPTWSPQTPSYDNIVSAAINMCKITDEGSMLPTKILQSSLQWRKWQTTPVLQLAIIILALEFEISKRQVVEAKQQAAQNRYRACKFWFSLRPNSLGADCVDMMTLKMASTKFNFNYNEQDSRANQHMLSLCSWKTLDII